MALALKAWIRALSISIATAPQAVVAAVIADSNIQFSANGPSFGFAVFQNEAKTDYTIAHFLFNGWTLSVTGITVDEGSDWYLASYGEEFSQTNIANHDFASIVGTSSDVGYGDFYLGVVTGQGFGPGGPPRNVYGWVHLRHLDNTVTMLGNAMSYQSSGIIVGTNQAIVPEPSAAFLFLTGFTLLFPRRYRFRTSPGNA